MDAFVGEVRAFAFGYAPEGWVLCNGQSLPVQQYQLLFAVISHTYGGSGTSQFPVPDLQGLAVMGAGTGTGLQPRPLASTAGTASVTLTGGQLPVHQHGLTVQLAMVGTAAQDAQATPAAGTSWLGRPVVVNGSSASAVPAYAPAANFNTKLAAQTVGVTGGQGGVTQPHENRQPYLAMAYYICADGLYPSPA